MTESGESRRGWMRWLPLLKSGVAVVVAILAGAVLLALLLGRAIQYFAPSDPGPPPVGLRVDQGVLTVVLPNCGDRVLNVSVSTSPLDDNAREVWFGRDFAEPGNQVISLDEARSTRGAYMTSQALLVTVRTDGMIFSGSLDGTVAPTTPLDPSTVLLDGREVSMSQVRSSTNCGEENR